MEYPFDIAQGLSPGDVLCIPRESVWRFPEYIFLIREMKRLWNVSVRPVEIMSGILTNWTVKKRI